MNRNKIVQSGLQKVLDSHGYGFQYSVLSRTLLQAEGGQSDWVFEVAELPVTCQHGETRIDFVLRHPRTNAYLVAECKRANPAVADWAFVLAPYRWRNQSSSHPVRFERVRRFHEEVRAESIDVDWAADAYHIGLELRTDAKGESHAKGRGALDEAVTQVLRGTAGFVDFLGANPSLTKPNTASLIIPVVITTATLWASNANLTDADLATGKINSAAHAVRIMPWILYQQPVSHSLTHSVAGDRVDASLSRILEVDMTRTIAMVNHSGIDSFLQWSSAVSA